MNTILRFRFYKQGRMIYISHLDMIRCMHRAISRARLPIAYSEGFHPHMETAFASTLPLGMASSTELMDCKFTQEISPETVCAQLNAVLPEGMGLTEGAVPRHKYKELAWADYTIEIQTSDAGIWAQSFMQFMQQEEILIEKTGKKGKVRTVDIRPLTRRCQTESAEHRLVLHLRLAAGSTQNLNPMLLLGAWQSTEKIEFPYPHILREALLTTEEEIFF